MDTSVEKTAEEQAKEEKFKQELLSSIKELTKQKSNDSEKNYDQEHLDALKKAYEAFNNEYDFSLGQLVKWKKGLKNRHFPKEGQPAIVLKILEQPIIHDNIESGSTYFMEPLNIVLGILEDDKGNFIVFHYDSRRFEPF